MIRHNTMSWTDTCLQHIIDEYMSLLSPSQPNHNHNSSASQSQSRSPSILYGFDPSTQSQSQSPNNHDSSNCNRTSPSVLFPSFATVSFPFAAFNSNHNQPSNTNAISCNSAGSIRPAVDVRRSKRTLSEVDYHESRISYPNPKRRRTNASQQPSSHDASGVDDEANLSFPEQRVQVGDFAVQYEPIFGTRVQQLLNARDKINDFMVTQYDTYVVMIGIYYVYCQQRHLLNETQQRDILKQMQNNTQQAPINTPDITSASMVDQYKTFVTKREKQMERNHEMERFFDFIWDFEIIVKTNPQYLEFGENDALKQEDMIATFGTEYTNKYFNKWSWSHSWISFCIMHHFPLLLLVTESANTQKKDTPTKMSFKKNASTRKVLLGFVNNTDRLVGPLQQYATLIHGIGWKYDIKHRLQQQGKLPAILQ
eukprot:821809_1